MKNLRFEKLSTPESLQAVRDIAADIWPKTFASILSKEQISYMMEMMYAPRVMADELAQGFNFVLLKADNVPAGYLVWSPYPDVPRCAKLHKLYLLREFHRQGIGSAMLQEAILQAKAAGFTRLRLNVNKHNTQAERAYLRNGFKHIESVKIDIGSGFFMDDFVMEKEL